MSTKELVALALSVSKDARSREGIDTFLRLKLDRFSLMDTTPIGSAVIIARDFRLCEGMFIQI